MNNKLDEILIKDLKENLSNKRFEHTMNVYETATTLAQTYEIDSYKCQISALAHDLTKEWDTDESYKIMEEYFKDEDVMNIKPAWHGYVASIILQKQYNLKDEEILNAVKYHTLGHPNMSNVAKVVYIADFIEPTRTKNNVQYFLNKVGLISLDNLLKEVVEYNLNYLKESNKIIPKQTLDLYDQLNH